MSIYSFFRVSLKRHNFDDILDKPLKFGKHVQMLQM